MSQGGNLSKVDFGKLVTWVSTQNQSGTLRITQDEKSKYILFDKGHITSTFSDFSEDKFRAVIKRMQILQDAQQLELEFSEDSDDGQYARQLIEKGFVTEREFLEVLKRQNQDIILSLFEWRQGAFVFHQDKFPKVKTISLKIPFKWVIEKGRERARKRREIDLKLPADGIFKCDDEAFRQEIIKNTQEMDVKWFMETLSTPKSIRDIVVESGLTEFETVVHIARFLETKKIVSVADDVQEISEEIRKELAEAEILFTRDKYWEAFTRIRNVVRKVPGQREIQKNYKIYAQKFKEDLQSTVVSADRVPEIVKRIDDSVYAKFPKESALGFLLSRIDGKSSIKQLSQILNIDLEKLFLTIYLLVKSGTVRLGGRKGPLPEELAQRRQFARGIWEKIQHQNHYEILGISPTGTTAEIKSAYFKMAKQFHPDARQVGDPADVIEKLDAVFVKMREAYRTLSDEGERKKYDRKLETEHGAEDIDVIKSRTKAQLQFSVGLKNLQTREYRRAMEYFRSAIDLDPYEPKYYGKLAEVCMKNPRWYRAGILACQKAIQLDKEEITFRSTLGSLFRLDQNFVDSEKEFRKVLQIDPANHTARSELQAMGKSVPTLKDPSKNTMFAPIPKENNTKK